MSTLHKIALTKVKGIGTKLARNLIDYFESPEAIFKSSLHELTQVHGIGRHIANELKNPRYLREAEAELNFITRHKIQPLWIQDEEYPRRLLHCEDSPPLLYYKGNTDLNADRTISIVGSRNATSYGLGLCEELIKDLQSMDDTVIISGLAYGIDVQAHRSCIRYNIPTVGVLGHGLDRIYPESHREVAFKMLDRGGLLTEFPSSTQPERANFPMRNRIIAGLADVTIVVEAAIKGGALITAEIANSYNRDVCAFPGAVSQEYSAGCNYLIKTHRAHLIRHADDLLYLMNWDKTSPKAIQLPLFPENLNKDETKVFNFIKDNEKVSIDQISSYCDWPQSKLAIILLEMEIAGHIISLPGKTFKIND